MGSRGKLSWFSGSEVQPHVSYSGVVQAIQRYIRHDCRGMSESVQWPTKLLSLDFGSDLGILSRLLQLQFIIVPSRFVFLTTMTLSMEVNSLPTDSESLDNHLKNAESTNHLSRNHQRE